MTPVLEKGTPDKSREETLPQPKTIASPRDVEPVAIAEKKVQEKQIAFEKELEETIFAKNKKQDGTRLIVYDFDAVERLRIVGLILAEALREELLKLGDFVLVNRENMIQVMEEYKLQHSGLVDEKQSIKIGQWLAANEAVTGMLAPLGATSILQAKRIDIKKMSTIALGSLKCPAGKEDELLDNMPLLARKLIQSQK
jgi:Curli production assembly/transport component CsgG.